MIEKSRLEELIKQGADIWKVEDGKVYPLRKDHYQYWNIKEDRLQWYCKIVPSGYCCISFNHLFETKEDAEEFAEFGNITRTERLELPSWEDVSKDFIPLKVASGQYPVVEFGDNSIEIIVNVNKDIQVVLWTDFVGKFVAPLTRENYNEARRICVKLFKGEEV